MKGLIILIAVTPVLLCRNIACNNLTGQKVYKGGKSEIVYEIASTFPQNRTVALPFDSRAYYKACFYPGDKLHCADRYPRYKANTELLRTITQTFGIEPFEVFKLESSGYDLYLVHFQGDDADAYDVITLKDSKVIATLPVGGTDGSNIKDFVITPGKVAIFSRTDTGEQGPLTETHAILETGTFRKLPE